MARRRNGGPFTLRFLGRRVQVPSIQDLLQQIRRDEVGADDVRAAHGKEAHPGVLGQHSGPPQQRSEPDVS